MFRYADNDNRTSSCGVSQRPIYILKQSVWNLASTRVDRTETELSSCSVALLPYLWQQAVWVQLHRLLDGSVWWQLSEEALGFNESIPEMFGVRMKPCLSAGANRLGLTSKEFNFSNP